MLPGVDGIDMWEALSFDLESNRTSVLHNIDDVYGVAALTANQWKIVSGKAPQDYVLLVARVLQGLSKKVKSVLRKLILSRVLGIRI